MSRVHDALRKAAQENQQTSKPSISRAETAARLANARAAEIDAPPLSSSLPGEAPVPEAGAPASSPDAQQTLPDTQETLNRRVIDVASDIEELQYNIANAPQVPYNPLKQALLVNPARPREAPAEEFRSLRTRLNHLQTLQPLHTLVVTSASPGEGKSFTATNLAVSQAQLSDKRVLLADFDFRRPTIEKTFQIPMSPGITDYLLGKVPLRDVIRRLGDTQLYVMTAGETVQNPLELLNLKECKALIRGVRNHFDWVILDSPPLLFAADANLLATMCDGTVLVVRIGTTTYDSVSRALQSLCENNVVGTVVNGARTGELYSKYTYYHNYYYAPESEEQVEALETEEIAVHADE
jgi:protein-tyrosine kinase